MKIKQIVTTVLTVAVLAILGLPHVISAETHTHQHNSTQPSDHQGHAVILGAATHTAVQSGPWSQAATWGGYLPASNALVNIPAGVTVTVDGKIAPNFKSIAIDGTLRFATNVDTELWVDTITSSAHGTLQVGTADDPIRPNVTARIVFADLGPINKAIDPAQLSRGAVLAGHTVMHGAEKTHRATVATFPRVGDSTIELNSVPVGWRVGDALIVTGAQGATSEEVRTIAQIDGTSISLNQPLSQDHAPPKSDLNLWIANTTRNVRIESENSAAVLRRGHIMFMHTHDVDLNYAGFYGLGRTDKREELNDWEYDIPEDVPGNNNPAPIVFTPIKLDGDNIRGRYALHVHRAGTANDGNPAKFHGSVVVDSPGWGFVNHSSNVVMTDNVSYNVQGAGFYTEAGDEIGAMVGNIAIRTVNESFRLDDLGAIDPDLGLNIGDFGNDGDGFWLSGTRVSVIDNVAAGASAHGIIFWVDGLIEPDTGRSSVKVSELPNGHLIPNRDRVPVWWAPLAEVRNNESYGATVGFRSRYIHSSIYMSEEKSSDWHQVPAAYIDTLNAVFDGVTVWGSRDGILLNYNERVSLRNAKVVGIAAPFRHNLGQTAAVGVGVDFNNEATSGPGAIENVSIEGFEMGLLAPRQGDWRVNNLTLKNVTDMMIHEMIEEPRTMPMTNVTFGSLAGTAVAGRDSERQNVVLDIHLDSFSPDANFLVYPDSISLNGREIYFDQQHKSFIPYGAQFDVDMIEDTRAPFNRAYLGKTNQQLMDSFGVAFGGEVMPESSVVDPRIVNGRLAADGLTPTAVQLYLPTVSNQVTTRTAFAVGGASLCGLGALLVNRSNCE